APPMRPMWVEFPGDEQTFDLDMQYMVGNSHLVAPVGDSGATVLSVYFPAGIWYDVVDNSAVQGPGTASVNVPPEKIPVFQREGSIVPRKERVRRSSALMRDDPYTLIVALDKDGNAAGDLYIDDEHTTGYKNNEYLYIQLKFSKNELSSSVVEPQSPTYSTKSWLERVVVLGLATPPTKVTLTLKGGKVVSLEGSYSAARDGVASRLIIRKPDINIAQTYTIALHY
ncbi:neutral alpha-glucosidase AB-like, partial [Hyalella azteca]|uniref:Neutral alpha-glucosidase AB-like n=1 Tax=Hyalella azteca TaxID=294128 RepID=A0A979FWM6_HYAAZ